MDLSNHMEDGPMVLQRAQDERTLKRPSEEAASFLTELLSEYRLRCRHRFGSPLANHYRTSASCLNADS